MIALAVWVVVWARACAALVESAAFGARGNTTLVWNEANSTLAFGPFGVPVRVKRLNMRVVDSAIGQAAGVGFQFWLLNATEYGRFVANETFNAAYNGLVSGSVGLAGAANLTELVIGQSWVQEATAYFVIHYGSRAPGPPKSAFVPAGPALTVAWDELSVVTGRAVNELDEPCGRRTVYNGAGQHLSYGPLVPTSDMRLVARTQTVKRVPNAVPTVAIVTQQGLLDLVRTGLFNLSRKHEACSQNNFCSTPHDAALAPYFLVLAVSGGSGTITFDYWANEGALQSQCSNVTAGAVTTRTSTAATVAGSSISPGVTVAGSSDSPATVSPTTTATSSSSITTVSVLLLLFTQSI